MRECTNPQRMCPGTFSDEEQVCPICGHRQHVWVPDHEQIAIAAAEVRAGWSKAEELRHRVTAFDPYAIPFVRLHPRGKRRLRDMEDRE